MAEDEKAAESIGSRRGLKNLPPLHTQVERVQVPQTSRWRRSRPVVLPPPAHKVAPPPSQPAPDPPAKLEHRKSSMSLFSLFSRPKVERARGHHESGLPTIPDLPEAKPTTALSPVTATPHSTLSKPADARPMAPKSRGGSFNRRYRAAGASNWEPPPLFQAYPQALKHATLQATNTSAEAVISAQAHKRQYSILKENLQSKLDLSGAGDEAAATSEKLQKREKRMSTSSSQGAPDLTQKVYVLATSGYLLQYSGEGPSDRMPEKILQLGKDSAAFACDLIPGKHWVLQISQSTSDDGTVTAQQPRSLLSRLRMQGAAARRTATSLLLVFDGPEEMGAWLTAIRQEIDILAGRRSRAEIDRENGQESGPRKITKVPSHRYMLQRDPGRFDSERSPIPSPVGSPAHPSMEWSAASASMHRNVSDAASSTSRFASKRQSVEVSSMATTSVSYDGSQLNQLREDSRMSMTSNRTSGTSPGTSTGPPSPVRDSTPLPGDEAQRSPTTLKSFSMSPNASSRRRSMPMQPLSPTNEGQPNRSQRHSTFGAALTGARHSPAPSEESGYKSPTPDGSTPKSVKNRMSFSRPFNLQPSHSYTPMPTIRSASAPPEKMSIPAGQAVSTDTTESVRPQSTISGLPSASTLNSYSVNRQTPSPKPGFRPIPVRTSSFMPARRISSLGPALPVNVNPTPALKQRASQPQLPTQTPPQPYTLAPKIALPPMPAPPPTTQLPPTPPQPQPKQQPALRRPTTKIYSATQAFDARAWATATSAPTKYAAACSTA
ncbi:hypothetical protein MPH_08634 [Macrophomina phaseolina MS6]|uniref:PH domain-containing protein n=1 Tax=Macrophomina phaseolina (strain MS6) TaxID=1126212 RepID=K2QWK0_MACPH|nr:hypothetical protein MPH_08634 [Macrophomina phaseolina MS6]